jgi:hypothetical protein
VGSGLLNLAFGQEAPVRWTGREGSDHPGEVPVGPEDGVPEHQADVVVARVGAP